MQLDEKVVQDQPITKKRINYIKGALIITLRNLEEGYRDQKSKRQIAVPVNKRLTVRSARQRFKLKDEDELRVNPSHLAHYTLSQIAYMDNMCNIYRALKDKA